MELFSVLANSLKLGLQVLLHAERYESIRLVRQVRYHHRGLCLFNKARGLADHAEEDLMGLVVGSRCQKFVA